MSKVWTLSSAGYARIAELQDKYKVDTTFEITETDAAREFLEDLRACYNHGLEIEQEDLEWIETVVNKLGNYVEDDEV